MKNVKNRKILEYGGIVAGAVLIAFGVASLYLSIGARSTVQDELAAEAIVGSADMNPADIEESAAAAGLPPSIALPTCDVAGEEITTGAEARCFAQYMRIHALEATGGLTYAQMGRYLSADDPGNAAGTSDIAAALKDESGAPVANSRRDTWVTETALATALNVSYMAEQIALFGFVVGLALLLSGIGFMILAIMALGRVGRLEMTEAANRGASPATG